MSEEHRFSVLVVDDETAGLEALNRILSPTYIVYAAKSGRAALKRAADAKPDLILLDVMMSDMSGFDVLVELKEMDATRDIPVIFITGLNRVQDEEKGFFLGAVDYITKPFNASIVKARVKTHMQIVKQIRTIERLVMVDALTELPNRRAFSKSLEAEWERAIREQSPISVLMIDVDRLKAYNDAHGRPQGDALLQNVARVITESLRPTDLTARIGGEEFAVLLRDVDLDAASNIAENIRALVESMEVTGPDFRLGISSKATVSVGVVTSIPAATDMVSDFMSVSEKALYTAKSLGRNQVYSQYAFNL